MSTGWSDTVKTSNAKELPPQSIDWYVTMQGPLRKHSHRPGSTSAQQQSHDTSTSARPSVLAVCERSTVVSRTEAHAHRTTSTHLVPSSERSSRHLRRSVCSSRTRRREADASHSPASVIWTESLRPQSRLRTRRMTSRRLHIPKGMGWRTAQLTDLVYGS